MKRRTRVAMALLVCASVFVSLRGCGDESAPGTDPEPVVPDAAPPAQADVPRVPPGTKSSDVSSAPREISRPGDTPAARDAVATRDPVATHDSIAARDSGRAPADTSRPEPVVTAIPIVSAIGTAIGRGVRAGDVSIVSGAPVAVRGLPRTFQVVAVPVPAEFFGQSSVRYAVEETPGFIVVGRRWGDLDPHEHGSALVTISIPASAKAGTTAAATVLFTADTTGIRVPIMADVAPVRLIALGGRTRIDDLRPGERFDLTFTVTNLGNADDTVRVDIDGPDDWRIASRAFAPFVVAAGATREIRTRVEVPDRSGTGGFFFRVRATGTDTASSQERTLTLAIRERPADDAPPGPVLRTGFGSVSVDGGSPEGIAHASITGPVAADVSIDARVATRPALDPNAVRGLNRVGAYLSEPRLSLWSPTWRFDAGSTVTRFTDLTGVNVGATGAAFAYDGPEYEGGLLLGRPLSSFGADDGHLAGIRGGTNVGPARLSAAFTSLDARVVTRQQLTAAGVQGSMDAFGIGTFGTELAWREFESGSGLGWGVSFDQQSSRGHISARVVHAPGGSSAFAHAVDEIAISADRGIGRFNLSGSLLSARDRNAVFDDLDSNAWSFTPQYRVTDNTAVRLSARGYAYDVRGAASFGNREAGLVAGLTSQAGRLFYTAEAGVERYTRSITLDGTEYTTSAPRLTWRGGASYTMPYGVLQLETSYDRTRDELLSPEQLLILLRAERMRFRFLPSSMYLNAEVTHQRWGAERSFFSTRVGAVYDVPYGFEIAASLERNPIASGLTGTTPVVFALRIDRVTTLPRLPYGAQRGRVFQDLNGNGTWDRDEPGAPAVAVRRNGVRAVTDRDGVYTFWESRGDAPIQVDAATLPYGWVVADHTATALDIPLAAISSIVVILEPGAAERARNVDLTRAIVIARDEAGREWIARRTGPLTAIFDALPAGTYTLDFNFTAVGEPLRTDRTYTVTVNGSTTETVTVRVQGRPLRFRNPGG